MGDIITQQMEAANGQEPRKSLEGTWEAFKGMAVVGRPTKTSQHRH